MTTHKIFAPRYSFVPILFPFFKLALSHSFLHNTQYSSQIHLILNLFSSYVSSVSFKNINFHSELNPIHLLPYILTLLIKGGNKHRTIIVVPRGQIFHIISTTINTI